jgi:anti-sigma-K factor RskA
LDVNPHRDEYLELCAGYALGTLTEAEQKTLEPHLEEGCPTCEVELDRLGRGVWAFASATPRLLEPSSLRTRVLTAVRTEPGRREGKRAPIPLPRRRIAPVVAWVAVAAAVVIAAFGVLEWQAVSRLEQQLAFARDHISKLQQEIQIEREWTDVLAAPRARVIELKPTPDGSPQFHARVAYDPATRRAVVAVSDFVTPPGKDYQLWAITKSGPASLGLVRVDSSGRAMIRLPNAGDPFTLAAFAVSLEEAGGAPTPNAPAGPVVMVGKI